MSKKTWPREHRYQGPSDEAQLALEDLLDFDLFRCPGQDWVRGYHRSWKIDFFNKFTDTTKSFVNNPGTSIFRAPRLPWEAAAATCCTFVLGEGRVAL